MIFGHQNNTSTPATPADSTAPKTDDSSASSPLRLDPTDTVTTPDKLDDLDTPVAQSVLNQPKEDKLAAPQVTPSDDAAVVTPASKGEPALAIPPDEAPNAEDLLNLKQEALTQLTPLVDHLDQTPEERFRTTMMMIQSADNAALIKEAYASAQEIKDDKVRAQALLDIVNEINYFTHKKDA